MTYNNVNSNVLTRSPHILKNSLSEALSIYYILAGRVVGNSFVDCNDEGVHYISARTRCRLADILSNPVTTELNKLIPRCRHDAIQHLAMEVQVSCFECGGLAVSLLMSHRLGDIHSFVMFLNAWAAIARGEVPLPPSPLFESASTLFPPRDPSVGSSELYVKRKNVEKVISKIFVFTASHIAALVEMLLSSDSPGRARPTRVEALSVFIWTRFMAARKRANTWDPNKVHTIQHPVNLRSRVEPPIPENQFGNMSQASEATVSVGIWDDKGGVLEAIKEAIGNMNSERLKQLLEGDKYLKFLEEMNKSLSPNEEVCYV